MKSAIAFVLCLSVALALPSRLTDKAKECTSDVCKDPCRCSSTGSPLDLDKTPQLISLTFDESIVANLYKEYWTPIINRNNPDGNPIGATFFVPHEYTDYIIVNELYNAGFEIAVHSITKNPLQTYWKTANIDTLVQEFEGQREIISTFANIPAEDIIGARTPQLQLNGNNSIEAYKQANLQYDSSWPTLPAKPLFPYTLDYLSGQQCLVAAACPNEPFEGFWVLPIIELTGKDNVVCNSLGECGQNGTKDEIKAWLNSEVEIKKKAKAPMTIRITSLWFNQVDDAFDAFKEFLDDLNSQKDVFLVTQKQVLEWIQNPVDIDNFKTETPDRQADCIITTCRLEKSNDEIRYMNSCVACPDVYPWLGNPSGKAT